MSLKSELKKEVKARKAANIPWMTAADRIEPRTCKEHEFFYKGTGNRIQCKCGVGYELTPTAELKDGHIYENGKLVF